MYELSSGEEISYLTLIGAVERSHDEVYQVYLGVHVWIGHGE